MELYNSKGERVSFEEYADRHQNKKNGGIVAATDMDNTMFDNDLGVLVFLEKLGDPHFWNFDMDYFASLVLPGPYYEALKEGAAGKHREELPPELSRLALDLHHDIVELYKLIKRTIETESNMQDKTWAVREFARKMVELDRIFIKVDRYLAQLFSGELLMRTRFFAGKELGAVHSLTERVMKRKRTDVYRTLDLTIMEDGADQLVSEDRITEVYGQPSPAREIDRYVTVVDDVRLFVRKSVSREGVLGLVITANLQGIGNTAVRKSPYEFIKNQYIGDKRVHGAVIGSKLVKNGSKLGPRMEDKPVLGEEKALKALEFAGRHHKKLGCAIGDSPTTDGPMMHASLREGGTAVIVGQDREKLEERFHPVLKIAELQSGARDRVYYIIPNLHRQR